MALVQIVGLAIKASLFLVVFALGLRASPQDLIYLAQRPDLLAKSVISMNVVLVVLAVGVAITLHIHPAVKIALVALACSPVPPILPRNSRRRGEPRNMRSGFSSRWR